MLKILKNNKLKFLKYLLPTLMILFVVISFSGCTLKELLGLPADLTDITKETIKNSLWKMVIWAIEGVGGLAGIFIVYGGILYMTALGNQEGLEKAKNTLTWAIAGLLLVIFAYVIVKYIVGGLGYNLPEPITT